MINLEDARKGQITFSNTDKRKTELVNTINDILDKGRMTMLEAQKLRGRMQFMDGQLFGRLGTLCMRAVTEHAFSKGCMRLAQPTVEAMRRFVTFLEHAGPRQLHLNSGAVWYIYTDACYEPTDLVWTCGLGGVLVDPMGTKVAFFSVNLSEEQMRRLGADHKRTIIFEAELLALVVAFAIWKDKLTAQCSTLYDVVLLFRGRWLRQGPAGMEKISWGSLLSESYDILWKSIIRPPRSQYQLSDLGPTKFRMASHVYSREDFQLKNHRDMRLSCSLFRVFPKRPQTSCVIYLHGNCSSRLEAMDVLQVILPRNMMLCSIDLSGSGHSEGEFISLGHFEQQDLKVLIQHLRSLGVTHLGLWGRSMGAATSILRAAEDWSISAIVLDSPFSSLPLVAQELVNSQIPVPEFMMNMALSRVRREILERANFDIEVDLSQHPMHLQNRMLEAA
eukprot:s4862_g3.t1